MPATFHSLPPELVSSIVLLSSTPSSPTHPLAHRQRLAALSALSLVCSAWRPVAQRALLALARGGADGQAHVGLWHDREWSRFRDVVLDEKGKERKGQGLARLVRSLEVEFWGEEQPEELGRLLGLCESAEEVVLSCLERVRFEQIAGGKNLTALSLRQCHLVAPYFPSAPPTPFSPPPFRSATLTSLDLRLCAFSRDSLPLPLPTAPALPALQNLLLHLGASSAHSQSPRHVRAFVRSVAGTLRALSLDHEAWEAIFPPSSPSSAAGEEQDPIAFPRLQTFGLYWDASVLSLVGSALFLPSPSSSASTPTLPPLPPRLHLSLYPSPSSLPALWRALDGLLDPLRAGAGDGEGSGRGAEAAWAWRAVEEVRLDGLVRDLEMLAPEPELAPTPLSDGGESAAPPASAPPSAAAKEGPRVASLLSRLTALGVCASIDPLPLLPPAEQDEENANVPSFIAALRQPRRGGAGETRGTFQRGFGTSWWRFVKGEEGERV
ncbi:hypothetical protein JCM10207_003912 [Rhodosporidiobolus poonsookiae]